jgi:type III secretory pathway component EscU
MPQAFYYAISIVLFESLIDDMLVTIATITAIVTITTIVSSVNLICFYQSFNSPF